MAEIACGRQERMDYRTAKAGEDMMEKEEVAPGSDAKKTEVNTDATIEDDGTNEDKRDEQEEELQEMPSSSIERRFGTSDRKPAIKREGVRSAKDHIPSSAVPSTAQMYLCQTKVMYESLSTMCP